MKILATSCLALAIGGLPWIERAASLVRPELRTASQRLAAQAEELRQLPEPAGVRSGNRIGFQSARDALPSDLWVDLEWPTPETVDAVVVVPAVVKGAQGDVPGFGFPVRFTMVAYSATGESRMLLDENQKDFPNPRFYPVSAHFSPFNAKRIRFTATENWHPDGPNVLAFAELLALSGNRDVALNGKINSGSNRDARPTWSRSNLLDLNTPLGLPVSPILGGQSVPSGYLSQTASSPVTIKSFTVALPEASALDEVRLVPVRRREMPSWLAYGFPVSFRIDAANQPDFSDAQVIYDHSTTPLLTPGQNVVAFPAAGIRARYIRLTANRLWERSGDYILAMAEMQIYSGNKNVALGAKVSANDSVESADWGVSALTDGQADGGRLLELPDWFRLLAKRQVLEKEHAALKAHKNAILESTERWMIGGSISAVVGIALFSIGSVWFQKRTRRREREQLRERFARDLHDELGSNLGSIALISSLASQEDVPIDSMRADLVEIERVARESVDSMHDMIRLRSVRQTAGDGDWLVALRDLASRLLRGIDLQCDFPVKVPSPGPDLETRRNVYLFCKEVLHNIAKHSGARSVRFDVRSTASSFDILIQDNGSGFRPTDPKPGFGLGNLRERATAMRGQLEIDSSPGSGTKVLLHLPRTHHWREK